MGKTFIELLHTPQVQMSVVEQLELQMYFVLLIMAGAGLLIMALTVQHYFKKRFK